MMRFMKTPYLHERITYTGRELRPLWCREQAGVAGDALVAFLGPCEVSTEHLVDSEDALAGDFIRAGLMLHFIGEHFGWTLREMILAQRLLVSLTADRLNEGRPAMVARRGDDLYIGEGKLSVSIATVSPVSGLLHFGLNVDASGAPVRAATLSDAGAEPEALAAAVLEDYAREMAGVETARTKVRPV